LEGKKINIFRLLYSIFYKKKGGAWNKARILGAAICFVALLTNTSLFSWNFFKSLSK
jgi:hypothetical protein